MIEVLILILIYLSIGAWIGHDATKWWRKPADKAIILLLSMVLWLPVLILAFAEEWRERRYEQDKD
jgi:hypothetical protein